MSELVVDGQLIVPQGSLLVLAGNSGCGKSTLAERLFESHQIVSADFFRGLLCGDEGDQTVTGQAWSLANQLIQERLLLGQTTVVDSVALQPRDRVSLVKMAQRANTSAALLMLWPQLKIVLMVSLPGPDKSLRLRF